MKDAAPRSHPLHITSAQRAPIAQTVTVSDRPREHVRDGLDSPMRVPRKPREIVFRILVPEVVKQEKRIELVRISKSKRATQSHPRPFNRGPGLNDPFDWSN
jgi:hypothetical protein